MVGGAVNDDGTGARIGVTEITMTNLSLPNGTVTFLFTDIEGSTKLWQEKPEAMRIAHARHDEILREAVESNHGYVFQIVGDSFSAAFHNAIDGLRAVLAAQRALQQTSEFLKNSGVLIRTRMGLHTGAAEILPDGKYEGYATIASTQRVMSAANGGQTLLTQSTYELLQNALPSDVTLHDMGEHRLKDLRAPLRLYQVNTTDLPQNFPAIKSLDTQPNNLPAQLTSFIGREKETNEIKSLLNSSRLVTLTGSGGTGKTRLSIEVGTEELTHFPNGVWLIELAPLSDESQIIPALAQAIGLQELPFNPLVNLVTNYLRDKKLLLMLDNCEHLIEACARLADDLLHQCAGLKILASSREALGIAGEVAYHTPSLADSESKRLFVERASAVNPKFSLNDSNASAISQICSRLDGIPLAIELAAARTKLLSVDQIAARLDDLFRLLVGGSRTALPRQQTMRASLEWGLENHIEENLRLAANFCVVSSLTGNNREGVERAGNAIERARALSPVEGDADIHRKKLLAKALYVQGMIGLGVGNMPLVLQALKEAIAISRATGDKRMLGYSLEMYFTATAFAYMPDRDEAALEGFQIFNEEIEDSFGLGLGYMNMSRLAAAKGNESEKTTYFEKLTERIREAPGTYQVAMFHLGMGMNESARGNYATAKRIFEDGRKIFKGLGSINFQLVMQSEIGHVERHTGKPSEAKAIYHETIKGWQQIGNRAAIAHQLECFGFLAIADEEPQHAIKLFSAAETLRERIQSPRVDHEQVEFDQSVAQVHAMLSEAEFNTLWSEGRSMTMEEAIQLALN